MPGLLHRLADCLGGRASTFFAGRARLWTRSQATQQATRSVEPPPSQLVEAPDGAAGRNRRRVGTENRVNDGWIWPFLYLYTGDLVFGQHPRKEIVHACRFFDVRHRAGGGAACRHDPRLHSPGRLPHDLPRAVAVAIVVAMKSS